MTETVRLGQSCYIRTKLTTVTEEQRGRIIECFKIRVRIHLCEQSLLSSYEEHNLYETICEHTLTEGRIEQMLQEIVRKEINTSHLDIGCKILKKLLCTIVRDRRKIRIEQFRAFKLYVKQMNRLYAGNKKYYHYR